MNILAPGVKGWTEGVEVEAQALQQLRNVAALPIVWPHVAVMPDVHWGIGATVGSVIPTMLAWGWPTDESRRRQEGDHSG